MVWCALDLLVLVCCATHSLAISRCSDKIIGNIKRFWRGSGVPQDVLKTLEGEGLLSLSHSTANFHLTGLDTSNAKCIYGLFTSTKGQFVVRSKDGSENSASFGEKESNGVILEKGDHIERYIVFSKKGVTSFYICNRKSGNKNGVAVGGVAVAINQYNNPETKTTIEVAIGLMRNLGIKLTKTYRKSCFKN